MKVIFLNTLFLFSFAIGYSQKCVVANAKENVAYVSVPNPLEVAVNGYLCKNFDVSTDNGKIEVGSESCSYTYYPGKIGNADIIISDKKSKKVLGRVRFRIKDIPLPLAKVAGKSGGDIRRNVLKAQMGITSVFEGFDFDARFPIERFTVRIYRDKKIIFEEKTEGAKFNTPTKIAFDKVQEYDRIVFTDIDCKMPEGRTRILSQIEFRILE